MATEFTVPLAYKQADVVSAQRLRFRHSTRLWVLAGLSLAGLVFLAVQQIDPALVKASARMSGQSLIFLTAMFVMLPVAFYLFVPALDYRSNQAWRQNYTLTVGKARLRLARTGAERGFELAWGAIRRVVENDRVFLVFFGEKQAMVMIPKSVFSSPEQTDTFRRLATPKTSRQRK